jgi:hypothetical protein
VEVPHLLALAQAAAAAGGERQAVDAVLAGIECVFGSPGYLLAAFSKRRRAPSPSEGEPPGQQAQQAQQPGHLQEQQLEQRRGEGGEAEPMAEGEQEGPRGQQQPADSQRLEQERQRGPAGGRPGADLDVGLIGDTLQALLRLYEPEVVTALGNACVRLLDSEQGWAGAGGGGGGGGQ